MKLPGALSALDDEQHQHLISLLSLGKTDSEIADAIQQDKGWLLDVKRATLVKNVNRWRKSTGQQAVLKAVTDMMVTKNGSLKKHIDVGEQQAALIEYQIARLEKLRVREAMMPDGLTLSVYTEESKVLFTMLQQHGKWQMDSGIVRKVRVGETANQYDDAEYTEVDPADGSVFSQEDIRLLEILRDDIGEG